ncbi:hypothetical protein PYK79_08235, partial [Streptomyces sp. ID05-04B]|uniref:hypothetical protein n=1 Tax=Streptomyces sp. ID05-04B TaxID=3028661 RepID=UPI0029C5CB77
PGRRHRRRTEGLEHTGLTPPANQTPPARPRPAADDGTTGTDTLVEHGPVMPFIGGEWDGVVMPAVQEPPGVLVGSLDGGAVSRGRPA